MPKIVTQTKNRPSPSYSLATPMARLKVWAHYLLVDHGILRSFWTNEHEIAPGVWRSNQPGPVRIKRFAQRGGRAILMLRAAVPKPYLLLEKEAAKDAGLTLFEGPSLAARQLLPLERLLELEDRFYELDKMRPFMMHCKSGADRTGLAAALWLILIEGQDVRQVFESQFKRSLIHFPRSRAGVVSHIFRAYLKEAADQPFRDWLVTSYDPDRLTADFEDWRNKRGRWA